MPKDIEKVAKLLRSAATKGERKTVKSQIVVNKSPSTVIKAAQSSGASIAVTDSPKTTVEIGHSSDLSVKVAESSSTSIFIDASHEKSELLICNDPSVAPLSISEPTVTKSPKVDAIIDGECINTQKGVDVSSPTKLSTAAANDMQLIGSHCKRSSSKPESQRKKIRKQCRMMKSWTEY